MAICVQFLRLTKKYSLKWFFSALLRKYVGRNKKELYDIDFLPQDKYSNPLSKRSE